MFKYFALVMLVYNLVAMFYASFTGFEYSNTSLTVLAHNGLMLGWWAMYEMENDHG